MRQVRTPRAGATATVRMIALCAVMILAAPAPAAPPPARRDLTIKPVLFQEASPDILDVNVGPDQRVWYQVRPQQKLAWKFEPLKAIIEREFTESSPQIPAFVPVLFESNGRVWFKQNQGRELVGYDGKTWQQCPIEGEDQQITGREAGHTRASRESPCIEVDGRCYFPAEHGVHVFDGTQWTFQPFSVPNPEANDYPNYFLRRAPDDGKAMVLVTGMNSGLWRHSAAGWKRRALNPLPAVESVAITCDTLFMRTDERTIMSMPLPQPAPEEQVRKLVAALGSSVFAQRQQAMTQLSKLGMTAASALQQAADSSPDHEVRARARRLLSRLTPHVPSAADAFQIGSYELKEVLAMNEDSRGAVYLLSNHVFEGTTDLGPGLLVIHPTGRVQLIRDPDLLAHISETRANIVLRVSDRHAWMPGYPVCYVDLEEGRLVLVVSPPAYYFPVVALPDGSVFVEGSDMAVIQPNMPDSRRIVRTRDAIDLGTVSFPCPDGLDHLHYGVFYGLAADGSVWAECADGRLLRYDGREWTAIEGVRSPPLHVRSAVFGGDAQLFRLESNEYVLRLGKECHRGDDLWELVRQHHQAFAAAFPASGPAAGVVGRLGCAVDGQGRIWLRDGQELRVLADGQWLDVMLAFGAPQAGSYIKTLRAIPNGEQIYIAESYNSNRGGRACLARVVDGKVVVSDAPHSRQETKPFLDPEGRLWVEGSKEIDRKTIDTIYTIAGNDAPQPVTKGFVPQAVDVDGRRWCVPANTYVFTEPDTGRSRHTLWSHTFNDVYLDPTGHVVLWSPVGFLTLRFDTAIKRYVPDEVYWRSGIDGGCNDSYMSPLGFVVEQMTAPTPDGTGKEGLRIIPIPQPAATKP